MDTMSSQEKNLFRSEAGGIEKVQRSLSKLFMGGFCDPFKEKADAEDGDQDTRGTAPWIINNDWDSTSPQSTSQDPTPREISRTAGREMPLISPLTPPRESSGSSGLTRSLAVTKKQLFPPERKGRNWVGMAFIFLMFAAISAYCVYLFNIEISLEGTRTFSESWETTKSQVSSLITKREGLAIPFLDTCPAPSPSRNMLPLSSDRSAQNKPSSLQQALFAIDKHG